MSEKEQVCFLTAVWGERYIAEFCGISLPSFLAEGNLPFLAAHGKLTVKILTVKSSESEFERHISFRRLKAICPVEIIYIDDLIAGANYGITLTLAYARGIMSQGAAQTSTYFVFMNSDFVLADGGGRTLAALMDKGHCCIVSASLRACAEEALPLLLKKVNNKEGVLKATPRELVSIALSSPHPTVIGKTVTQRFVKSSIYNQLYWQVDKTTLLGRNHLIFMLAIKPEVEMQAVNSYCDYGFIPEMVPSGKIHVIEDSDDFFMLELQPTAQEKNLLSCGTSDLNAVAKNLNIWTTKEHRQVANFDTIFHAGEIPENIGQFRAVAANYIEKLHGLMVPPLSHVNHFYWAYGVQAWNVCRLPAPDVQPESKDEALVSEMMLSQEAKQSTRFFQPVLSRLQTLPIKLYLAWKGIFPKVSLWHPRWQDARLIMNALENVNKDEPCLIVKGEGIAEGDYLNSSRNMQTIGLDDAQAGRLEKNRLFTTILVLITPRDIILLRSVLSSLETVLARTGRLLVFIRPTDSIVPVIETNRELAKNIDRLLPLSWLDYDIEAQFAGGRLIQKLGYCSRKVIGWLQPQRRGDIPAFIAGLFVWPFILVSVALENKRHGKVFNHCLETCTSALLILRKHS